MRNSIMFLALVVFISCSDDSTLLNQNGRGDQGTTGSNQSDAEADFSDTSDMPHDADGPECTADGICSCENLPVDRCSEFPECYPMAAYEVATGSACTTMVNVTCAPEQNCDNNIYFMEDLEGNCLVFPGGCVPPKRFAESERCKALAQDLCGY
ncbi:hypothetical protein FRD01_12665 [Microvenator marinus]|uniref:Uncharacterized protein n=1 Tax=Microvenator marinus TaxID=2600177 RepID=A0A5B8XQA8_9DELT|nr:hypothetical protein [Microvenator marinus]QED28072.1 hypothetical protein FRD01_12665 [Microvenator marinus]